MKTLSIKCLELMSKVDNSHTINNCLKIEYVGLVDDSNYNLPDFHEFYVTYESQHVGFLRIYTKDNSLDDCFDYHDCNAEEKIGEDVYNYLTTDV